MAVSPAVLVEIQRVSNVAGVVYTTPVGVRAYAQSIFIHETTGTGYNFKMWKVPTGDSRGDENRLLNVTIPANDTVTFAFSAPGIILAEGDTLHMQAGGADKLNVEVSGFTD